jgi:hypothetical protein
MRSKRSFDLSKNPSYARARRNPVVVVHSDDSLLRKSVGTRACCHSICENLAGPGDRAVLPSSLPVQFRQARLASDCRLLSEPVVDALECLATLSTGRCRSDRSHGCIPMRTHRSDISITRRRRLDTSSSRKREVLRLTC